MSKRLSYDERYTQWRTTILRAQIWYCDDECECTQPQVVRLTPNLKLGFPCIHYEVIWQGTYHSMVNSCGWALQKRELRDKAKELNIVLDDDLYGERKESDDED